MTTQVYKSGIGTVAISDLKRHRMNPPSRTEPKNLTALAASIAAVGVLQPLLIAADNVILDGHRRYEAAKMAGLKQVPYNRIGLPSTHPDADALYVHLNANVRRPSSREWLQRYVMGGSVSGALKTKIRRIEAIGGSELVREIADANLSPGILDVAQTVRNHCLGEGAKNDEFLAMVVRWLVSGRRQYQARRAIRSGVPPQTVAQAVEKNRDIVWVAQVQ